MLVREPIVRWTRASLRAAAAEGLHAQQCSPCKDACSLAGAVGIKAEVTLAQRAKVAAAKPSERSLGEEKRACPISVVGPAVMIIYREQKISISM